MKGLAPLFLGIFGTFAFSWVGLTVIPNWQIGHLNPQSDEEGTDIYPMPQSGMVTRGARVYAANGCNYCHSEQVRAEYSGADIERKWGDRRSAPRDYIFERPVLLGKMRMGQDLANIGARAPKEEESPSARGRGKSRATSSGGFPGRRGLGEGRQSAASNFSFACNSARNVTWCYCIETANQPRSGGSSTFKICRSSSRCGHKSRCSCITACGRTTVARANGGIAANVFRCLASRASLFAAQYQS